MLLGAFFEWRHWLAEHAEGCAEKYCILRCLAKLSNTHSEKLNAIRWLESLYHSAVEILLLVIIGSDSYHVFPVILCCATGCVTGYAYSIKDTCIVCAFHSLLKLIKASSLGTFKWYQMIYDRSLGHLFYTPNKSSLLCNVKAVSCRNPDFFPVQCEMQPAFHTGGIKYCQVFHTWQYSIPVQSERPFILYYRGILLWFG